MWRTGLGGGWRGLELDSAKAKAHNEDAPGRASEVSVTCIPATTYPTKTSPSTCVSRSASCLFLEHVAPEGVVARGPAAGSPRYGSGAFLVLKEVGWFMQGKRVHHWLTAHEWNKLAATIRDMDEHYCQRCGLHSSGMKRNLDVHHIIDDGQSVPCNLVSLCRKCHLAIRFVPPPSLDFDLPARCTLGAL
jgi:hypothetical protein